MIVKSNQSDAIIEVIDQWLLHERKEMRTIAHFTSADLLSMVVNRYHEIRLSKDKENVATNAPNRVVNDVIERFANATVENQNHLTAMVCQMLITCLTMSSSLALQNAAGVVTCNAKQFGDMTSFMNALWSYIDTVGIERFSKRVRELEAMPADAIEDNIYSDSETINKGERNMGEKEEKKEININIENWINKGQANIGGGVINVASNEMPTSGEKDLPRLITDYLEPANRFLKEGWGARMYDFWQVVVEADIDIFSQTKNKGDKDFNKMYVFYVVGYLRAKGIYQCRASRNIVEAVGENGDKYRCYIDKRLDSIGDYPLQEALEKAIDTFISKA